MHKKEKWKVKSRMEQNDPDFVKRVGFEQQSYNQSSHTKITPPANGKIKRSEVK